MTEKDIAFILIVLVAHGVVFTLIYQAWMTGRSKTNVQQPT
jgi:hypothetical protein